MSAAGETEGRGGRASEREERSYTPNAVHMMRTAQLAQLQLSAMADTKASILMGATFVIFTITIGRAQGGSPRCRC